MAQGHLAGRVLGGRYRLEHPIGSGGMSVVYHAIDESLGRAVAVKVFTPGATEPGRQESELSVLASLEHHSLVQLYDAGVDVGSDGVPLRFLVMALVTGPTLSARNRAGALAPRHIAEIGYDLAEALEYIHSHGVIHRDIKPSNIMLVDYGNRAQRARAKLTDFGIALADDVERLTAEGATTGTAAYLSPEQVTGQDVGPASDVYALGLVLLECFTRTVEFGGGLVESAVARLQRDPRIPDDLPDHWKWLLFEMTAREPAQRLIGADLVSALRSVVIAESERQLPVTEPVFPHPDARDEPTSSEILDTSPDLALQHATALAARIFSAPIAVVSVVDEGTMRFKSFYGSEVVDIARQIDVSSTVIPSDAPVVIEDGRTDPRSKDHPLVTGPLKLRFYVSVPLRRSNGTAAGTLSVLGIVPATVRPADLANLEDIGALIMAHLEASAHHRSATLDLPDTVAMPFEAAIEPLSRER
jgi:serine/threonine protein kinase